LAQLRQIGTKHVVDPFAVLTGIALEQDHDRLAQTAIRIATIRDIRPAFRVA
jgi:hypothetical protein